MADLCFNHPGDPFANNAITDGEYPHVQSTGYAGTDYDDITAPATPNYPINNPARYFIELPQIPNISDLSGARPWLMKDVTNAVTLTRVSGAPGSNQYRYVTDHTGIYRPQIVELNASQAGAVIAFDYYGEGTVINANNDEEYLIKNNVKILGTLNINENIISNTLSAPGNIFTFSGLDITKSNNIFELAGSIINTTAASDEPIDIYINSDYLTTNYYTLGILNDTGVISDNSGNAPLIMNSVVNSNIVFNATVYLSGNKAIIILKSSGRNSLVKIRFADIYYQGSIANITRIDIKGRNGNNVFAAGSNVTLFKKTV